MNYLDLFSGIGGFHKGLEEAGFKFEWSGHSEIDKYAKSIYQSHFKESEDLGNVSNINVQDLPAIDLVTFGFPCQDLSIAGKRGGLQSSRSGLFYQAIRIIEAKRPAYFIFENVKGLFSSNGGRDFASVLRAIADIGYDGQWQLLNTRWFLPQNRERVYFVGYPRNSGGRQIFPIGEGDEIFNSKGKRKQGEEVVTTVRPGMSGIPGNSETYINVIDKAGSKKNNQTHACTLTGGGHSGGNHSDMDLLQIIMPVANCITVDGYLTRGDHKRDEKDKRILTSMTERRIRRFTPTECELLQGYIPGWTATGKDGEIISDTQRYKTLGNAVSVPVVKAVGERLRLDKQ